MEEKLVFFDAGNLFDRDLTVTEDFILFLRGKE